MSRHTFPPTPAIEARNAARQAASELLETLVVSELHGYRARTRLASDVPPPDAATEEQVRAAVAATAPPVDETSAAREAWNARSAERSGSAAS